MANSQNRQSAVKKYLIFSQHFLSLHPSVIANDPYCNTFNFKMRLFFKIHHNRLKLFILDGDLLAVHSTKDVRNGQIVVARIEDEVTVKRLERKGSVIYLHAENEEFQPIVVNLEEQPHFEIEGIAVGIIRNNAWM